MSAVRSAMSNRLRIALAGAAGLVLAAAGQAKAQVDDIDEVSSPVVQQIPAQGSIKLNAALGRLGRNPRDVPALIDAGIAALEMGDVDAAVGFYQRADTLSPGNSQVKAGLAGAYVRNGDPFTAIPLFAEAAASGPIQPMLLAERGLAYDLVGDNETAQRYYRESLASGPNDEATRRLALSQAISGDRRGMETTLAPLLQRQDKAAWRIRAFSFAILGLADEAEAIARSVMPADLAAAITPYLRYMSRLTPAQQAAAANSGQFPRAAEIGLDDPRVANYSKPRRNLAATERSLVPSGQPMGRDGKQRNSSASSRSERKQQAEAASVPVRATAPSVPAPTREVTRDPAQLSANTAKPALIPTPVAASPAVKPPIARSPAATPPSSPAAGRAPAATPPAPREIALDPAASKPADVTPGISAFDLAQVNPAPPPVSTPSAAKLPVEAPPVRSRSLADVFADLGTPSREAVPVAGAVDMRRIAPSRAATDPKDLPVCKPGVTGKAGFEKAGTNCKAATPPPPSHPSRIWVQLAAGRDKRALGFDWRKLTREEAAVLRNRKGYTSAWGQTNRLLTGPFESEAAANAFNAQLRRAGMSGSFVWTSPAGQIVDALAAK